MKKTIHSNDAPKALGPYSQAVMHNGMIYCSGQIALDPQTMEIIGSDAAEETEQIMKNLGAVLAAAGSSFSRVLKCTIYLSNMADFKAVNEVYGRYFEKDPPARETVAVKTLPKEVNVEISCIAAAD